MNNSLNTTDKYIKKINRLIEKIEIIQNGLSKELKGQNSNEFNFEDNTYWKKYLVYHILEKIKSFSINFSIDAIESVSLIAIARYLFEIHIQLELLKKYPNYVYCLLDDLVITQEKYYKKYIDWLNYVEIPKLKELEEEEKKRHIQALLKRKKENDPKQIQEIMKSIDTQAEREFLIYSDDAQILGYGLTAWYIENKIIPIYEKYIEEIKTFKGKFEQFIKDHKLENEIKTYKERLKTWRKKAEDVNLQNMYDLMYFYSSNLLHGTPLSVVTEKRLKTDELFLFLKFIYVELEKILSLVSEIIQINKSLLKSNKDL